MKREINPTVLLLHCSTTKHSYELAYVPEQLKSIRDYWKICRQMDEIRGKYPNIKTAV